MGSIIGDSDDSEDEKTKGITFNNDDISFLYTAFLILYNLDNFRKYISEKDYPDDSGRQLGKLLKRIFSKDKNKINVEKYAKKIYLLIAEKYKLEVVDSAGKILIIILELINYEENGKIVNIWENHVLQNQQLFKNSLNLEQAYKDFINGKKENHDTKVAEFFQGILLKRKKIYNINYVFLFSSYFVYELDLPYISLKLISKGKNLYNVAKQRLEISLIDCLYEMQTPKNDILNGQPCLTEHFMYNAPPVIFFLLNRENDTNPNSIFTGDVTFNLKEDFSKLICDKKNDEEIKYKLISVIKEKKFNTKKIKKEDNENYEDIKEDNNGKTPDKYLAIYREEDNNFYYYNNIKKKSKIIDVKKNDDDYYIHLLVYQKC